MVGCTLRCQHLFSFLMSNAEPNKKVMRFKISTPFIYLLHSSNPSRSLTVHNKVSKEDDGNENVKKQQVYVRKTKLGTCRDHACLYISLSSSVVLISSFLEDQNTRRFPTFFKTQIQFFKLNYIIIHYYLTNRTTRMKSDEILKQCGFTFQETFSPPESASLLKLLNTITSHKPLELKTIRRHMMVVSFLERRQSNRSTNANVLNIRCAFRVSIKDKNNWQVPSDTRENSFQIQETRLTFFFIADFQILTQPICGPLLSEYSGFHSFGHCIGITMKRFAFG